MIREHGSNAELRGRMLYRVCRGTAVAAGAFCVAVAFMLAADLVRYRRADPLNWGSLSALRDDLRRDPRNRGLQEEIRALDLLARRAHVSHVDFARTGAWLLLGGAVVLLAALKTMAVLEEMPAVPGPEGEDAGEPAKARRLVVLAGAITAATAAGLIIFRTGLQMPRLRLPGLLSSSARMWDERLRQWPAFRGPDGLARAASDRAPVDWDGPSGRNILWKSPVPRPGFSSPVVWGDRVFLTGGDEEAREVFCFDAADGRILWRSEVKHEGGPPSKIPAVSRDTGYAAPTPAADGRRVYAVFATGDLAAFDFNGRQAWGRNLGVPENPYGHASSLLVWRDLLVVQYDQGNGARVIACRTATGETAWERTRPVGLSWSSPILIGSGGTAQLVLNGNPFVMGYKPDEGRELWRVECLGGEVATSPASGDDMVFAANQYSRLAAIRLGAKPALAWEWIGDLPEVSSPLAAGPRLFLATGAGTVTCLEAASGRVLWKRDFPDGFYASPVLAGNRVYLTDRAGVTRIFEAAGEYRFLGEPALGEPTGCTPAFVGDRIYLRGERSLFCIAPRGGAP